MADLFPTDDMPPMEPMREATPEEIADLIRDMDRDEFADMVQQADALPPVTITSLEPDPVPLSLDDEIAAAEALLTPEQREARRAMKTPIASRPVPVVDRSTLQYWGTCPQQAALRELEPQATSVTGNLANVGNAIHHVISMAIWDYMNDPLAKPKDIKESIERYALETPFDVQTEVVETLRYSAWRLAELISDISPMNILGFDGGPIDVLKDRSGQIAADFTHPLNWRGTLELDLFYKTAAPTIIEVVDYKSGWKIWTPSTTHNEFQFQFAALLIFLNYPDCMEVHFTVWTPRTGGKMQPVVFLRSRMTEWMAKVYTAAVNLFKYRGKPLHEIPAYPGEEKCSFCPVARACHLAYKPAADIDADPEGFADQMYAVAKKLEGMQEVAKAWVKKNGHDLVSSSGAAFGTNKPKKKSSPRFVVYGVKAATAAAQESTAEEPGADE